MENKYIKTKSTYRKDFLHKRNQLDLESANHYSMIISKKILSHPKFIQSTNIMVYIPFRNEVDIKMVIEEGWKQDKNILAPRIEPSTKKMEAYKISSWQDLDKGSFGLMEPNMNRVPFSVQHIELLLVPGVAFDCRGFRLGYGGGYYDRFFDRFPIRPVSIGVAYDLQIVNRLPIEEHDYKMSIIITEEKLVDIK